MDLSVSDRGPPNLTSEEVLEMRVGISLGTIASIISCVTVRPRKRWGILLWPLEFCQ